MGNLVGLVGWRGMVGSVLIDRMQQEKDFDLIEPVFFSTSNAGGKAPAMAKNETTLKDANDIQALAKCDIILTGVRGGKENRLDQIEVFFLQHAVDQNRSDHAAPAY